MNHILQYIKNGYIGKIYYDPLYNKLIFKCGESLNKCLSCPLSDITAWYMDSIWRPFCTHNDRFLTTKELLRYMLYMGIPVTRKRVEGYSDKMIMHREYNKLGGV